MTVRRLVSAVLVLAPLTLAAAGPGDVFHDEITVTATGSPTPVDDVPADVTVVDRQELERSQLATVAAVLRRVPGVLLLQSGGPGSAASLFSRGTESDHTLVMLDGVRLNSPYFGGYDWSLLPTAGLERIEVVRGPASALYGADAVGGVVNLVPRRPAQGVAVDGLVEAGEGSWQRAEANVAAAGDGWDLLASGFSRDGKEVLANSDFASRQGLVDLGFEPRAGVRLGFLAQHLTSTTGIPFDGATTTPRRRQHARQELVALPVHLALAAGWDLEASVARVTSRFRFRDPEDAFGYTAGDTATATTELRLLSHHRLGRHTLSWGGEWRRDRVDDSSSYGVNLSGARRATTGVLLQDEWRPAAVLAVVAGLRWDHADHWGGQLSPRVAVGWTVAPGWQLRAGWGGAFRQPSLGELYFPGSGNPLLEPERGHTVEASLVRLPETAGPVWRLTAFATRLSHLIDFEYSTYSFRNVARARIHGVEAGLDVPLGSDATAGCQLTWLDTADGSGAALLRRPRLAGACTVDGTVGSATIDLAVEWVGPRDDVDPVTFARTRAPGFVTADIAIARRLAGALRITARASNLLDRSYAEVLGYPAPGRRLFVGLQMSR